MVAVAKGDKAFGSRLRALREGAGLTQAELADAAGMVPNSLARLERGVSQPSWETVVRLAAALGVEVGEFVVQEDDDT
jgi:transcriptional regulator with XRE-family HTH domain